MKDPGRVVILGAGPTGLGAAYRLHELGVESFTVLEAKDHPGGLASSYVDREGFLWDVGGHVQFSHYDYYDGVLDRALGDAWLEHRRESWVWLEDRFVPYPFQNNLHRLRAADRERALAGLEQAAARRVDGKAEADDFRSWILDTFGEGLAEIFMFPYNAKVWGHPLEQIGVEWMGDKVATPDLERVRRNLRRRRDDVSWGPNRRFRFPRRGGTGAIWHGVAGLIPGDRLSFGSEVTRVELDERRLVLSDGRRISYDALVTSLPLDRFCALCADLTDADRRASAALVHSSCHILGAGLRGGRPPSLDTKCWIYFPEDHSPYYRVTVFSNYSPHNVPAKDGYWSLMAEVCETPHKPVDVDGLESWTLRAMLRDGLITEKTDVVSFWHRREEHGYPTPFRGRDRVLGHLLPALERHGVYSRGRFGAWKYEVSNQDHSFMQGVEVADRLLGRGDEPTLHRPDEVNRGIFLESRQPAAAK
ncbi:MAG: FAD-dependent oxidoreductase [Thermoanaerobaculia bacterium]